MEINVQSMMTTSLTKYSKISTDESSKRTVSFSDLFYQHLSAQVEITAASGIDSSYLTPDKKSIEDGDFMVAVASEEDVDEKIESLSLQLSGKKEELSSAIQHFLLGI